MLIIRKPRTFIDVEMATPQGRDRLFWSGLWIFAVATSVSSMVFMGLTFWVETQGGSIRFIEPNRMIAAAELATVVTGMVSLMLLFMRGLREAQ